MAMASVEIGMREEQVLSRVGPPDEVRQGDIDTTERYVDSSEIWYFGTSGPETFPTFGRIYFGKERPKRVCRVFGKGETLVPDRIDEESAREIISAIGTPILCHAEVYNPHDMIQVVNLLQVLGKDSALALVGEYLRVCPEEHAGGTEKVMLLLRALFVVPANRSMPTCRLGHFVPPPPENPTVIPRFPIHFVSDVPLLMVHGYQLEGAPGSIDEDIKYFSEKGQLRQSRLNPPDDPWTLFDELKRSGAWTYRPRTSKDEADIFCQLLKLCGRVLDEKSRDQVTHLAYSLARDGKWQSFWEKTITRGIVGLALHATRVCLTAIPAPALRYRPNQPIADSVSQFPTATTNRATEAGGDGLDRRCRQPMVS